MTDPYKVLGVSPSATDEEVKKFLFNIHLKNHLFEYILKIILKIAFAALIVFISGGKSYIPAIIIGLVLGLVEVAMELKAYKKDYIEFEIAKRK